MAIQRKSLGRGLGSIISAGAKKTADSGIRKIGAASTPAVPAAPAPLKVQISAHGLFTEIPTDKIATSPYQARREFSEDEIKNLAESISSEGLLQPILVRQIPDGYELLAGERRLRACKLLGMRKIVACVQNVSDASAAAKGLIENIQRANLNPIETARGIAYLVANFHLTQEAVSQRLGKQRSTIANLLRLLNLPESVQGYIASGMLSLGTAKVIMGLDDKAQQEILARKIIENGLNVRGAEDAVRRMKGESSRSDSASAAKGASQSTVVRDVENKIALRLNAKVELKHSSRKGKIVIEYLGNDDLHRILEIMGVKI